MDNGRVIHGSKSDEPVSLTNSHPASSYPAAQQSMCASGDSKEGSPCPEKSKLNENNVFP